QLAHIPMQPCWAVMLQTIHSQDPDYDAAEILQSPLIWVARNDTKPGRAKTETASWVLHADPAWSEARLHHPPDRIAEELTSVFLDLNRQTKTRVIHSQAHLWRFAFASSPLRQDCLWDPGQGLGVCGDWCLGSDLESAFLSGQALAGNVLRHVTIDRPTATAPVAT
ncbi:MAG: deoxyribodipyrimidine photolyase, partial [Planctomycetota bacterium]